MSGLTMKRMCRCEHGSCREGISKGWLLVILGETPVSPCPALNVCSPPDLAHLELHHGLREVAPGDELLDALPAHFEQVGDLSGSDVVVHDRNHSQESTRHLTSGQALRETSHMTREAADCQHCGKGIRRNSKGIWGARKHDDPHPWFCDASPDAAKRHEPAASVTCRIHGEVQEDHFPCRRPGESGMEFTSRALGETRDV